METMDPKKPLRESHTGKSKGCSLVPAMGKLVCCEEILLISESLSDRFTGETGAQKMMASGGQDCSLRKIAQYGSLVDQVNLNVHVI